MVAASGPAIVAPLSGRRLVAAVGAIAPAVRAQVRRVLADTALIEEHNPTTILHRTNVALAARGLGRLDGLILATSDEGGTSVASAGDPVDATRVAHLLDCTS